MFTDFGHQESLNQGMDNANRVAMDELSDSAVSIIVISSGDENDKIKQNPNGNNVTRQPKQCRAGDRE